MEINQIKSNHVLEFTDEPLAKRPCKTESADSLSSLQSPSSSLQSPNHNPVPSAAAGSLTSPTTHNSSLSSMDKSLERLTGDHGDSIHGDSPGSLKPKPGSMGDTSLSPVNSSAMGVGSSYSSCQYGMPSSPFQQHHHTSPLSSAAACQQVYYPHHTANPMQQPCTGQLPGTQNTSSACALAAAAVSHPLAGYSMPPPPHSQSTQSSCSFMGMPSQSAYPSVTDLSAMNLAYKAAQQHFSS